MIESDKDSGRYTIICDEMGCGQSEDFDAEDFKDFIDQAKNEGWTMQKKPDGWHHRCCVCTEYHRTRG